MVHFVYTNIVYVEQGEVMKLSKKVNYNYYSNYMVDSSSFN